MLKSDLPVVSHPIAIGFENNCSGLRKMEATDSRNKILFYGFFRASVAKKFKMMHYRK